MTSSPPPIVKAGLLNLALYLFAAPALASPVAEPLITPAPLIPTKTFLNLGERSIIGDIVASCSEPAGGTLPIADDCASLSSKILASSTTYSLPAASCVSATAGTCVGAMCAPCSEQKGYDSVDFSNAINALIGGCLLSPENEVGTGSDSGNEDEILWILEYNADGELPPYSCDAEARLKLELGKSNLSRLN